MRKNVYCMTCSPLVLRGIETQLLGDTMSNVLHFPCPDLDSLESLDAILVEVEPNPLYATPEECRARWAKLHRDSKARAARAKFSVVVE